MRKENIFFNKHVPVFVVAERKKESFNESVNMVKNVHYSSAVGCFPQLVSKQVWFWIISFFVIIFPLILFFIVMSTQNLHFK